MSREIKFNATYLTGRTQSQQEILAGVATCGAKWGTRAVRATDCQQPITMLQQDGRRRWIIQGFCETHGTLTRDLQKLEGYSFSWASLSEVFGMLGITSTARAFIAESYKKVIA
jgi:hypothetical protein